VASLVDELNQSTNLTHNLVVLNNKNWLFKNCYLVKIMQLYEIKMSKLLMLKSVSLNLFIQWCSVDFWEINHVVVQTCIWSSCKKSSLWMWCMHYRYQNKFIKTLYNILNYIDFILLWCFYYSFVMLIIHLKIVLIKALMQFHFAHLLSWEKIDLKFRHIKCWTQSYRIFWSNLHNDHFTIVRV